MKIRFSGSLGDFLFAFILILISSVPLFFQGYILQMFSLELENLFALVLVPLVMLLFGLGFIIKISIKSNKKLGK